MNRFPTLEERLQMEMEAEQKTSIWQTIIGVIGFASFMIVMWMALEILNIIVNG